MENELQVIAQCQRCGRGFIRLGPKVKCDPYAHPKHRSDNPRPRCNGGIFLLAEPVGIEQFENYGPILPIAIRATPVSEREEG